jgi:predicted nucleic acid-binding protein
LNAYADTSFLLSLYSEDADSATADSLVKRHQPTFLLTPFGEVEFMNAVESRLFRQEVTRAEARTVHDQFASDLRAGVFQIEELKPEAWQTALRLSGRHTARLGTRTLDVLHVAAALTVRPDAFLTFDQRQRKLAHTERLHVLPR